MINPQYPDYFSTLDGIKIFFTTNFRPEELDEKDTVIVFHYGLGCNINHYKFQIPYFHGLGFKILIHDYRFHHNSSSGDNFKECSFQNIVSDITQLLNFLKIKKSFHIGHSMGVNIALEFAFQNPHKTLGMALISGTVLPPQDIMFNTNLTETVYPLFHYCLKHFPNLSKIIWKNQFLNPITRFVVLKGGFNSERVSDDFIRVYLKKMGEIPPEVFFHLMDEMKAHNILSHLEKISTPALVMGGDRDKVIPNYLQEILQQHLPEAQLYIIKDGSHVPQVDFHETVNIRIKMFLENLLNR